jgi:hypothetical protein
MDKTIYLNQVFKMILFNFVKFQPVLASAKVHWSVKKFRMKGVSVAEKEKDS